MAENGTKPLDIEKKKRIARAYDAITIYFSKRKREKYNIPRPIKLRVGELSSRKFFQLLTDLHHQCDYRDGRLKESDPIISESQLQKKLCTLDKSTYMKLLNDTIKSFNERGLSYLVTSHRSTEEIQRLSQQYCKVSVMNENLKQKKLELELAVREKRNKSFSINYLKNSMYKSDTLIAKFEAPKDGIPYVLIVQLTECLSSLTAYVSNTKRDFDVEGIFKTILSVNEVFREINLFMDVPRYKKQIFVLRLAISHMITSIRFFLLQPKAIPKLAVISSISDIHFKLCVLVNQVGMKITETDESMVQRSALVNGKKREVDAVQKVETMLADSVVSKKLEAKTEVIPQSNTDAKDTPVDFSGPSINKNSLLDNIHKENPGRDITLSAESELYKEVNKKNNLSISSYVCW